LHFNYRIVQAEYKDEPYFEIRTIHYNNAGEICFISKEATIPIGNSVEELHRVFNQYLLAFENPILIESQIKYSSWDMDLESSESSESIDSSDELDFLTRPITQ